MEQEQKSAVNPTAPARQTILIVEDEPTLRALVRKVLERGGFQVIEAPSGLAALELWNQKKPHVDLLLTDMVMPDGISGRQLAEKLKSENPKLKVIYTTGYSPDLMGKDFVVKEGVNFLQKPYPPQKLVETVRNRLASE
ncbi:MAG: response regulator [Verrucomicrobiota bacterium]|jgi:CheY-like chemotaxis protein